MLFLGVKQKVSHKWFRKTICSVDIIYTNFCGLCSLLLFSYTFADDMFDFVC